MYQSTQQCAAENHWQNHNGPCKISDIGFYNVMEQTNSRLRILLCMEFNIVAQNYSFGTEAYVKRDLNTLGRFQVCLATKSLFYLYGNILRSCRDK